ncbi:hypothetical protein BKA58DRAFT_404877 [Alternaria rosae]|uniref:uncharacterized protein n=1 Tax=Alternaria rosae TaxID=1187941 RepID=UPI001E8EB19E|nr:uncharacterized protein BKA58DRAFT_404877 [Alternaria rosae]KAH6865107.1 hypothetical protein BKA58DRAFT_404877 [Alternaria rosae]
MTTSTDPTVPLPTETDKDRKDKDDDDDDDVSSTAPAPTPTPPTPNPPGRPSPANSPQSSQTSLPSPTSTEATASAPAVLESGNGGLGVGASAGIGAAVAVAIILLLLGGWFCVRRRRAGIHRKRTFSQSSHDLENAAKGSGYGGPAEMEAGTNSEKSASELASPVVPVEALGDRRHFTAELPGSEVPPDGGAKGSGERLFPDSPIDDEDGQYHIDSKSLEEKKASC